MRDILMTLVVLSIILAALIALPIIVGILIAGATVFITYCFIHDARINQDKSESGEEEKE